MVSGFDIWGHDEGLRRHWKYRFLAFLVDAAISFIPVLLALQYFGIAEIVRVGIISSIVFYFVSNIPEMLTGSSLGKKIFGLEVHATDDKPVGGRACIRNIPKLLWFGLLPLDFALGLATRGDPRQRIFDRLAGTKVVHSEERERHEMHLESMASEAQEQEEVPLEVPEKDKCHDCGGEVLILPDEKLQCKQCGLIQ